MPITSIKNDTMNPAKNPISGNGKYSDRTLFHIRIINHTYTVYMNNPIANHTPTYIKITSETKNEIKRNILNTPMLLM